MKIYKAFLYTIVLVIIQMVITVLITFVFKKILDQNGVDYYVHGLGLFRTFVQLAGYLIFFSVFWKPTKNWIHKSDLKINNFKVVAFLFIIGVGLEFIKSPFFDFKNILNYLQNIDLVNHRYSFNGFDTNLIYRSIGAVILAPILEELFFRKYLLNKLRINNSKLLALIVSSSCFALIHIETPDNLIPAFIFGFISGIIYLKTDKIGYSMLLHFICNSLWFLDLVSGNKFYNYLFNLEFNTIYWIIFILGILMTYLGLKIITSTNND